MQRRCFSEPGFSEPGFWEGAGLLAATPLAPAYAQGGGEAQTAPRRGAEYSPIVGAGQSPSQAAHDNLPNHTRQSPYAHPSTNPNQAGDAASDGTAGTSSPRSPEPKPGG